MRKGVALALALCMLPGAIPAFAETVKKILTSSVC